MIWVGFLGTMVGCSWNRWDDEFLDRPISKNCDAFVPFYDQQPLSARSLSIECCADSLADLNFRLADYTLAESIHFNCSAEQFDRIPSMPSVTALRSEVMTDNVLAFPNLRSFKNQTYLEEDLSANLFFLDSLRELVLVNPTGFPDILGTMPLEVFKMTFRHSNERRVVLPDNLPALKTLKELRIEDLDVVIFSDFEELTGLRKLRLSKVDVARFPRVDDLWPELSFLEMNEFNVRGQLPDVFADMTQLDTVLISRSEISTNELTNLCAAPKLRSLSLRFCEFETIPEALGDLSELEHLTLSVSQNSPNAPVELPGTLNNLTNLRSVSLKLNTDHFPTELAVLKQSLESLMLSDDIGSVPALIGEFSALRTLRLNNCGLTALPSTVQNLADTLEELYLEGNDFDEATRTQIRAWLPETELRF